MVQRQEEVAVVVFVVLSIPSSAWSQDYTIGWVTEDRIARCGQP